MALRFVVVALLCAVGWAAVDRDEIVAAPADQLAEGLQRQTFQAEDVDGDAFSKAVTVGEHYVFALFYASWSSEALVAKAEVSRLAARFSAGGDDAHVGALHPNLRFLTIDGPKYAKVARQWHVRAFPTVFFFVNGAEPWVLPSDLHTEAEFAQFMHQHLSNHRVHLVRKQVEKEERVAQGNHDHPSPGRVVDLEPATFDHFVGDPHKAVLVLFYAPWCGHCKDFKPRYEGLASFYEKLPDLLIAQIDTDAHDQFVGQRWNIEGIPHFRMFPKGRLAKHDGLEYKGPHEISYLKTYIDQQLHNAPPVDHADVEIPHHEQTTLRDEEHDHDHH